MNVQAAPNTHPGGVHGALFRFTYQSDTTPFLVAKPPMANAAKFISKNRKNLPIMVLGLIAKGSINLAIYQLYLNFKFAFFQALNDKSPLSPNAGFHLDPIYLWGLIEAIRILFYLRSLI